MSAANPSARRRVVFLDFDGTYAMHGVVPDAHAEAVRRARANGHDVLLCTGRPLSILAPAVTEAFDGIVSSAGARVDIDGQVLCDHRYPPELARRTVDVLETHGVAYCLEAPDAMYTPASGIERLREQIERLLRATDERRDASGPHDIYAALTVPEDLRACSFAKVSVWDSPVGVEELAARIGAGVRPLPNSVSGDATRSGELQLVDVDKADGVALVARHLGLGIEDTVGAGDGMNDVGMLAITGTSIGIEGSPAAVLEHADLVVPRPEQHGLVEAFERLGLLDDARLEDSRA